MSVGGHFPRGAGAPKRRISLETLRNTYLAHKAMFAGPSQLQQMHQAETRNVGVYKAIVRRLGGAQPACSISPSLLWGTPQKDS